MTIEPETPIIVITTSDRKETLEQIAKRFCFAKAGGVLPDRRASHQPLRLGREVRDFLRVAMSAQDDDQCLRKTGTLDQRPSSLRRTRDHLLPHRRRQRELLGMDFGFG